MTRTKIKDILGNEQVDYSVTVKGWVRSFRNNQFIAINDGSCFDNIQAVISLETDEQLLKKISNGASISVTGMVVASQGKGQRVAIKKPSELRIPQRESASTFPHQYFWRDFSCTPRLGLCHS